MSLKADFEREFVFDIDAYLIEQYPHMSLADRRAICNYVIKHGDEAGFNEEIEAWVVNHAMIKAKFTTLKEILDEEDEDKTESGADDKSTGS